MSGDLVVSTLAVSAAVLGEAGPYSCTSTVFGYRDFPRARVRVHLLQGENYRSCYWGVSRN